MRKCSTSFFIIFALDRTEINQCDKNYSEKLSCALRNIVNTLKHIKNT